MAMTERSAATLALVVCAGSSPLRPVRTMPPGFVPTVPAPSADGTGWDEVVVSSGADAAGEQAFPGRWSDSRADYLVFVPAGCGIAERCPDVLRALIHHNPDVELAYADSSGFVVGDRPHLVDARHRPGFSPDRLRVQMYLGELFLIARTVAESVDPDGRSLRAPLTLAQAHAVTRRSATIAHVPELLSCSPVEESESGGAGNGEAVSAADHDRRLAADGFPATAAPRATSDVIDLVPRPGISPPVSIVIPTMGAQREIERTPTMLCLQAIDSLVASTDYPHYELVVVVTPGAPQDIAAQVMSTIDPHPSRAQPPIRFCRDERPFNFSNACNRGAIVASGRVLVFLNDDTKIEQRDWLDRLVMYATRPDVGAVGARLLYGDGRIQHAGIWSRGGHPSHRYERFPADHPGHLDSLTVAQNCLAVTGACLAVAADKFHDVGGFSPEFPSSYNDVDLCLKLDDLGYRTVVDPGVVLTHYEASSRDPKIDDWELELLHERWRSVLVADPFDNPNHLAPGSDEDPAPDPMITDRRRRAGLDGHLPRLWPRPRLTVDPMADVGS